MVVQICIAGQKPLKIISNNSSSMVLEFVVDSSWISANGDFQSIPTLDKNPQGLPVLSEIIVGLPENVQLNWFENQSESINITVNQEPVIERSKGLEEEITFSIESEPIPSQPVSISSGPTILGHSSAVLEIHPIVTGNNGLQFHRRFTIQLTWDGNASLTSPSFLSQTGITELPIKRSSNRTMAAPEIPAYQFSENLIQVIVDTIAWYQITYNDFADSNYHTNMDPSSFQLWHGNEQLMIFVEGEFDGSFDENDKIIFQGFPAPPPEGAPYRNNFYTNENVYWLTWGGANGLRYAQESAYPNLPPDDTHRPETYTANIHIEKDEFFTRLGSMHLHERWDTFDHYFMNPAIDVGTIKAFEFTLPHPQNSDLSSANLALNFQGITTGDHTIQFLINDHIAGSGTWENQASYTIQGLASQEFLTHGNNVIDILNEDNPNDDNYYDQVYLNWIEIEYQKYFNAYNDEIEFARDGNLSLTTQFEIDGFSSSNIHIFKEGVSKLTDFIVTWNSQAGGYTVILQDFIAGDSPKYYGFTDESLRSVKYLREIDPLIPINQIPESEYIIVAPDSFKTTLEPLAEYHNATFVDIDKIYRMFSDGIVSPYAIKDFFTWTYNNWSTPQKYALIAMQGKWLGWQGVTRFRQRFIPAMRIQTVGWGSTSSDYWYTLVDGDDFIPEFAIGRFPAANNIELEEIVNKSIMHLNNNNAIWHNQVLNIGGYEQVFKDQSERLIINELENGYFPQRLYIEKYSTDGPFYGTTDSLIGIINNGISYLNYLGHGGGAVWTDKGLLNLDNIQDLTNQNKYFFVNSMTCFSGDVTNPNALGRNLISMGDAGVISWFGSSGVGWIQNDYLLLKPLHENYFSDLNVGIGDIINLAKIQYYATNTAYTDLAITQIYQFNLSGDPALKPPRLVNLDVSINPNDPEPGEALSLNTESDSLSYVLYDETNFPHQKYPESIVGSTIPLSDTVSPGRYTLLIKGKDQDEWKTKSVPIQVSGSTIRWISINPLNPTRNEPIAIQIEAVDRHGIDSLSLIVNGNKVEEFVYQSENYYSLTEPLQLPNPGYTYTLKVKAVDTQQNETWSSTREIRVRNIIDVRPLSISHIAEDSLFIKVTFKNSVSDYGEATLSIQEQIDQDWIEVGRKTVNFNGVETFERKFPILLSSGDHLIRAITTADDSLSNTQNDTLETIITPQHFWVTPQLGTTEDLSTHTSIRYEDVSVDIASGSTGAQYILSIDHESAIEVANQPGLTPALEQNITINSYDNVPYDLYWNVDTIPENSRLFTWNSDVAIWHPWEYSFMDSIVFIQNNQSSKYAFFHVNDSKRPILEAAINGQRFLRNSYLSSSPIISVNATDENGLNPLDEAIQIFIGDQLQNNDIITQKIIKDRILLLNIQPSLTSQDEKMSILVFDVAGNASDTLKLEFIVREKLDLIDYGNYPNPFIDQTRLSYELTESVEEFQLDIYTIDGRRIRRFDESSTLTDLDPRVGAFHEIIWDGKTDKGDFVANGVYFYRMKAKKGKTIIERKGKIVKAR